MVAVDSERESMGLRLGAWLLGLALLGCGDSSPPGDGDGTAGSSGAAAGSNASAGSAGADMPQAGSAAGAGEPSGLVGVFLVNFVAEKPATDSSPATPAHALLFGKIKDGEDPQPVIWELEDEQDDCKLFVPRVPFCDPDCGSTALCVEDGECAPYAKVQDLGMLAVTGLGDSELSIRFIANNYQSPTLSYPPCAEGAAVRLTTSGGAYSSFMLESRCIAPLEISGGGVRIERGQPLALRWPAPGQTDLARIEIKVDISHHGGAKGKIECDVADDGSLDIPATLVDQLVELGVAGFPTVAIARVARSPVAAGNPERVALEVAQSEEQAIEIPGLVSCTEDTHCPMGQTCQADLTCK
jgi:hypothetical protein